MGRSAYDGVSDGEWAVFAEKACIERDEERLRVQMLTEEVERLRKECERLRAMVPRDRWRPIAFRFIELIDDEGCWSHPFCGV